MWLLTENPWPVIIALSVVAVGAFMAWNTRGDNRLLIVVAIAVALAGGAWELERRIVTERERLESRVLDLRDVVQDKELFEVLGFFSDSELLLKGMATTGLAMVNFEDQIRVTALETTVTSEETLGETRFRANVSLSVVGFGSVGHQPTLWALSWRKEADEWRIVKVRRFHPLSHKELPPLARKN